ncbi:hypothetical protein chiPu_0024760, partial [Chiloscyllium punctatum]|nr:hypothetical protein [Chiloscyllium punctatum]
VFGNKANTDSFHSPSARDAIELMPSESASCLLQSNTGLYHRGLLQADHSSCPLGRGQTASRPVPADYPTPDIITIEHNYCSRRAARRGTGTASGTHRLVSAHRWSCGAAALRSTRQHSRTRAQARIEVDEAVDLVVGIQQASGHSGGKREVGTEPGDSFRHRKVS